MATDIKLEEHEVVVEGFRLRVKGADLILDHPDRRNGTGDALRRALVHGEGDKLIINFNQDYSGGTYFGGSVKVGGADIMLDAPSRRKVTTGHRRALVHDFNDGLTINWANDYPGGVTINGKVNCPGDLKVGTYDIEQTFANLLQRIAALEAKVSALENR